MCRLLAPFGVGTVDQALLGIVAAKHFFVRQFGLAGKVVILDEVHSYDLYTGTLIGALVKRLRELECTVIILSATLTENRRRELLGLADHQPVITAYPLVSGVVGSCFEEQMCEAPPSKTIQIRNVSGALLLEEAIDRAHRGECLLWIRNTVDEAQQTYRALQSAHNRACGPGRVVSAVRETQRWWHAQAVDRETFFQPFPQTVGGGRFPLQAFPLI